MKIAFAGGATGGHFYPIIAVSQEVRQMAHEQNLLDPKLYFFAPDPYNQELLFQNGIAFQRVPAGKMRRYFSVRNVLDMGKTALGVVVALVKLFAIYPDVLFSKGGYASFPVVFAARFLRIPIIIHESDAVPGRVNAWAAPFARKIAVSYAEAQKHFAEAEKVAHTGNPIRNEIKEPATSGAFEFLELDESIPTLLVLGGSQGAERINDAILDSLPHLIERYQIIHQAGRAHEANVRGIANVALQSNPYAHRYKLFGYLNDLAMRMSAGAASLVITRAGSALFEVALWKLPAIVIPIPEAVSHDQRANAFAYARETGAVVIEEHNLTPSIVQSEAARILENPELRDAMIAGATSFARDDAARTIARAVIEYGLSHESE